MAVDRVSFTSSQLQILDNLTRAQFQYRQASIPATSGLRINTLSDDPTVISRVFSLRDNSLVNEQYSRNTNTAQLRLNYNETQLARGVDVLQRVRDITLKANDPTIDTSLRTQIGNQIADLKSELLGVANAKLGDKFIFAGSKTSTQPFTGVAGVFNGNKTAISVQMSPTLSIQSNLDGDTLFRGNVKTAVTTDTATTLKNNNGVGLGVSVGDVITIAGTIGAAFSSTLTVTSATTLADIAAAMQVALRAAGNNTELAAVQADGSIKVTSGATAITGLTLSISGNTTFNTAFTYATPIAAAGGTANSDTLKAGTGEDLMDLMDDLQTAVSNGNQTDIATHLQRLDQGTSQLNIGRAQVGSRTQQVDANETFLQSEKLRILSDLSNLQDANVSDTLSTLTARETALRLVFASSAKILQAINGINLQG